jgi:Major Facilitator Superfamily
VSLEPAPVTPSAGPPRWREIVADGRGALTAGLIIVEALAGVQSLVVTATMPRVLADLHGLAYYGWVFSGYSLAGLAAIPRAGRNADRQGPLRPFAEGLLLFGVGTVLCGVAPSMLVLALVRIVQGYGGAMLYTVAYGAVAKGYPERLRARVLALLTLVWVISGLVGPAYGAALAAAAGWRWSFLSVLPFVVLSWVLIAGPLRTMPGSAAAPPRIPQRSPVQLAVGTGLVLAGLSSGSLLAGALLTVAGLAVAAPALRHVLPAGTLRVHRGYPATVVGAFLTNLAFFAADSFVPLLLTGVRGTSVLEASVAVTLVTLGWSAGGWWQSRVMSTARVPRLVGWGSLVMTAGIGGTAAALVGLPLPLVYVAWVFAGLGMGVAYSTLFLAALEGAAAGNETTVVAARFVSGRLGIALGSGLGGASVAIASSLHAPLAAGLWGIFGMALAASLLTVLLAGRLRSVVTMPAGAMAGA